MGCVQSSSSSSSAAVSSDTRTQSTRELGQQLSELEAEREREREREREITSAIKEVYYGFIERCCEIRKGAYCMSNTFNMAFDNYVKHVTDEDLLRRLPKCRPLRLSPYITFSCLAEKYACSCRTLLGIRLVSFANPQDPIYVNHRSVDIRSELDDIVTRLNEMYYAPGMPGCLEAKRDFDRVVETYSETEK